MAALTREQVTRLNEYVEAAVASANRIVAHLGERGIPESMQQEFLSLQGQIEESKLGLGVAYLENDYSEMVRLGLRITALYTQMSELWKRIGVYDVTNIDIPSGRDMQEYFEGIVRKAKEGVSTAVKVVGGLIGLGILWNLTRK